MPLRKKHVRRIVFAALVVGVLGPAAALVLYGLALRGGAYGDAVARDLESRLRCQAAVRGARPTGPSTAAADAVSLVWTAGSSRLDLQLDGLRAESNRFGWYVNAEEGRLSLTGPAPWETLAALNQRLVQAAMPRLMALTVKRLTVDLDLGEVRVQGTTRAGALSNLKKFRLITYPPDRAAALADETMLRPTVLLDLDPTSDCGVFDGLRVEAKDAPLNVLGRLLRMGGGRAAAPVRGTADIAVDWPRLAAPAHSSKAVVTVAARQADLAEWTSGLPGGPVRGTGTVAVQWSRTDERAPARLAVEIAAARGEIGAETLRWLAGLPAGMRTVGKLPDGRIPFDRIRVRCAVEGNRGRWEDAPGLAAAAPLITCRMFGVDVPLLVASPRTFDAGALWAALRPALGQAPAKPALSRVEGAGG